MPLSLRRDRLAVVLALLTATGIALALLFSRGPQFLMPGPLVSAHGVIENCSSCHSKSGQTNVSWIRGIVSGDPHADGEACISCHKISETPFNPHGAPADVLERSTARLKKMNVGQPEPQSARAQNMAFPTDEIMARGVYCATCHQEHQGVNFDLNKVSGEQCRSCHVLKFDRFDNNHPKFESYPFSRRTRIIYDHGEHFRKHYPELAGKELAKHVPKTCASCHNSRDNKMVMGTTPFDQTCASCHLDQILGKERASGPKGIAFLTVPGLDLHTLKKKEAAIGDWPDASEAVLTPFMKVMIAQTKRGRNLIKELDGLDLLDLTSANDRQVKGVVDLAWEIKKLFHALISGKASDVLGDLNIARGAKLSPTLVADLTASIPRDVLIRAQQKWLPNLATEMVNGPVAQGAKAGQTEHDGTNSVAAEAGAAEVANEPAPLDEPHEEQALNSQKEESEAARKPKRDPPICLVSVLGQCLMHKQSQTDTGGSPQVPAAGALPEAMRLGFKHVPSETKFAQAAQTTKTLNGQVTDMKLAQAPQTGPGAKSGGPSDDLLFPTQEELREMKALNREDGYASNGAGAAPSQAGAKAGEAARRASTTVISLESDVDPESWADYGGWYQQDHAIFYRPVGHKDKFLYTWLFLTGPQAPKSDTRPATAVFDLLIDADAPGSCAKCHSVDDLRGNGRVVNFSPLSAKHKKGQFTNFVHQSHFGVLENRGCLHCHKLEKKNTYLKSYKGGDPQKFASNFGQVTKDICQACHTQNVARQDCLLCHSYHVDGVRTPIINTKIPNE